MSTPIAQSEIQQPPFNATFMGAVIGAANHLGTQHTGPAFFCESGFAFALNIHPQLCPSAPYCWNHEQIFECLRQLGIHTTLIPALYESDNSNSNALKVLEEAFSEATLSIASLEQQLVTGMNHEQLDLALPWGPGVPSCSEHIKISDLADRDTQVFGFHRFDVCKESKHKERIQAALNCALRMYREPKTFQYDDYTFGLDAFNTWKLGLKSELSDLQGHWWNAVVWSECRYIAAEYFGNWNLDVGKHQAKLLAERFSELGSLLEQAASPDLDVTEKSNLIEKAGNIESEVPELIEELLQRL